MITEQSSVDIAQMMTLADITKRHAMTRPSAVALSFEGRDTTYLQFHQRSNQVAHALLATGVSRGDRIGYLGKNCDHYFELLFGAAKIGAVITPVGWRLAPAEAAFILQDSNARVVFVGPDVSQQASAVLGQLETPLVVAMAPDAVAGAATYERWRDAASSSDLTAQPEPDDVVAQMYTSGTTGRPKGAMLTHANMLGKQRDAAKARMAWHLWATDEVSLVAMPVAHVGGTLWGLVGLLYGAKGIVAREFDPLSVLDYIERDRVSKMFMVPAALQIVVRQPRSRTVNFERLRYILYGASPMP
ncbi:MAG: long-chain-fatty-acid--CoA ligase, partial [Phenylobacterium sp.]|nr:long-chain-fatty-acid--CoA ligase [Phenylobacterium sp.]